MLINIKSNAKINLGLKILNKRDDGYHDILTFMQEINIYDNITISKNKTNRIILSTQGNTTPCNADNLCYKAAKLFLDEYKIDMGIDINLNKNIPISAGLGGGSSNAVNVIKGLYNLFNITTDVNKIYFLCSQIGADVPFFIRGGLQKATGIGHKLEPLKDLLHGYYFLVIYPNINVPTKWAYGEYKKYLENISNKANFMTLGDPIDWSLLENDFEKVVLSTYPKIRQIKECLIDSGSLFASLSGSGSTMFGVYDNLESVEAAKLLFKDNQTYKALPVY